MRKPLIALLVGLTLLSAACSKAPEQSPAPTPAPPVSTPGPVPPPVQAPAHQAPPAQSPPPTPASAVDPAVQALNDQSFLAAQAGNWGEAEQKARAALALDGQSAAAWFNLGKAQLASIRPADAAESFNQAAKLTNRTNVDVEYNLAKALFASGQREEALYQAEKGMQHFPNDPDLPKLLAKIKRSPAPGTLWLEADMDGHGAEIAFWETPDGVRAIDAAGTVIYKGEKIGARIFQMSPLQLPDGSLVVHVAWQACVSAAQNQLLWYNPAVRQVQDGLEKEPCANYAYDGEGTFSRNVRQHPFMVTEFARWEQGILVPTGSGWSLIGPVYGEQIGWTLGYIASVEQEIKGAEQLFASPELYQRFLSLTPGSGWMLETVTGDGTALQVRVTKSKEPVGQITVQFDGTKITDFTWPPTPR